MSDNCKCEHTQHDCTLADNCRVSAMCKRVMNTDTITIDRAEYEAMKADAEPSDEKLKAMRDFAMRVQLSHDYDWVDYMRDMYFIAIDQHTMETMKEASNRAIADHNQIQALQATNKKLLNEYKKVRQTLEDENNDSLTAITDTIWMQEGNETLFDYMDSIIAEAELK